MPSRSPLSKFRVANYDPPTIADARHSGGYKMIGGIWVPISPGDSDQPKPTSAFDEAPFDIGEPTGRIFIVAPPRDLPFKLKEPENLDQVSVQSSRGRRHAVLRGRAANVVDVWSTILPARIVNEEIGDYLEDIHRRCAAGQQWCVYLRVVAAIFWTGVNSLGYFLRQVGRRRRA